VDEGTSGVEAKASAPDEAVHRLEERSGEIRENLSKLVDELDHRRHRLTKSLVVGVIALVGLSLGGVILWRRTRRRPSRMEELARALRRIGVFAANGNE
jgi:type VI protein secretion system component VasF